MLIPDQNKKSPGGSTTHVKRYIGPAVVIKVQEDGTQNAESGEDSESSSNFPHLTANRIVRADAAKELQSVVALTDWVAGTANEITVTDDGDGTITISLPDDITLVNLTTTGGRVSNTTRATTTYQILVTDHIVFCNTDGSAWTATLPAGAEGQTLKIINSGSSGETLTLAPNGAEHLIGANSNITLEDSETIEITYNSNDGWY